MNASRLPPHVAGKYRLTRMEDLFDSTVNPETYPLWFPLELFKAACDLARSENNYDAYLGEKKVQTMEDGWNMILNPRHELFVSQLCKASPKFAEVIFPQLPYMEKDEDNLCRVMCLMIKPSVLKFCVEEIDNAFEFFLKRKQFKMCRVFLARGRLSNPIVEPGLLPKAATACDIDTVKFLIRCGATDVSDALFFAAHGYRFTPKESNTEARRLQMEEIMKVLIEAGANETIIYNQAGEVRTRSTNSIFNCFHFLSTYEVLVSPGPFEVPKGYTFSSDFEEQSKALANRLFGKPSGEMMESDKND